MHVTLTNPLPEALAHYEAELRDCLADYDPTVVGTPHLESVEGFRGWERVARGLSLVARRMHTPGSDVHVVIWPALGYFDALTWVLSGSRQRVVLIMHDIDPLHPHFGYSRGAHAAFRAAVQAGRITVACHTHAAAGRLAELTGVQAHVVPHPMLPPDPDLWQPHREKPVLRVLGRHKTARDPELLASMAQEDRYGEFDFEIWGSGWPEVPGWQVQPDFFDESTFSRLVSTSSAVTIPYREYSQSGVMVRAAESCVPVVGLDHPQMRFLYGEDWPGLVPGEVSWLAAARRAIRAERAVAASAQRAHDEVRAQWQAFMELILR